MQFFTTEKQYTILISKKGKITIKGKNKKSEKPLVLSHNRKKKYILPENEPIPFLIELGVQAEAGIKNRKNSDRLTAFWNLSEMYPINCQRIKN